MRVRIPDVCACLIALLLAAPVQAESLFDATRYQPLIKDHRARQVGDLLTVLIYETASSTTSADRETNKSLDVGASASFDDSSHEGALGANNDSAGGGSINRTGRLVASVSVTVESILPNGEMLVRGEQSIQFNDESQFIRLEGRVRPEDITASNTVLSTRVADARIKYVGEGLLGRTQKPGLITNFFNWIF